MRLISSEAAIRVNQSPITGSELPVLKQYGDISYRASWVVDGDAFAYVINTGRHTFVGRALKWLGDPGPSKFAIANKKIEKQYLHTIQYFSLLQLVGIIFLIFILISIGTMFLHQEYQTSPTPARHLLICILGLLTILNGVTTRSKIDQIRILGKRRLSDIGIRCATSVECLAGVDILCTDITGTVTEGRVSVQEPFRINCTADEIILTACLTVPLTESNGEVHDQLDRALLRSLKRHPEAKAEINRCGILDRFPFSNYTKHSSASVELPTGERIICYKGAPLYILRDVLEHNSTIPDDVVNRYETGIKEARKQGWRCLGIARRSENGKMELLGFIPFVIHTPRYDSAANIRLAKSLGVSVKFLTGFSDTDAAHALKLVGVNGKVLSCDDCGLRLPPNSANAEISTRIEAASGFAEVFPEDKKRIVQILQSRGHVVAIVGDGVNDSPALKMANCGIATDKASSAATSAADMKQIDQGGLGSLIQAIQISRQTLEQSYNYLVYETIVVLQCIGLWSMWSYKFMTSSGAPLSPWWLILHLELAGILSLGSLNFEANTLFLNKPSTWKRREFLILTISIYVIFVLGVFAGASNSSSLSVLTRSTGISLQATHGSFARWSAQNTWLFSIITGHPQFVFLRTQGRLWSCDEGSAKALVAILIIDIVVTTLCLFGCVGEALSVTEVSQVWLVAFVTVCATWFLHYFFSGEKKIRIQVIGGK